MRTGRPRKYSNEERKAKQKASSQKWCVANRERTKAGYYRREYGLSPIEYNEMYSVQDGKCLSCGTPIQSRVPSKDRACVDHDHATGKVRGLLCLRCNAALGFLDDSPEKVAALLAYITEKK